MIILKAVKRESMGRDSQELRGNGLVPGVIYGSGIENQNIQIQAKDFEETLKKAGETSLITLDLAGKKYTVLVKDMQLDAVSDRITHVDFYVPNLKEETHANVPLQFVGEALAVKELKGTLVKSLHEVEVKCLPQDIPHEIIVDISSLATFEDQILVKNLQISDKVQILKSPEETVAFVARPADIEKELETPIEGDVEKVEKIEKEKKEEVPAGEAESAPAPAPAPKEEKK